MDSDYDIFVSYSSDVDERIFEEIVTYFESHDKKVYQFPRDNIEYGQDIKRVLEEQIRVCRLILVMVTPRALESEWVRWEIDCANRHNKYTIAVCPYDFSDNDLPTGLRDKLAIKDKTVERLRQRLESILENLGYTAYIPAGGFGGGMVEFCAEVPKALCHIGDRPMLFHVIDSLDA